MYVRMRMVSCISSIDVVSNLDLGLRGCWRRFACRLARAVLANSYGYSLRAAHTMRHATHPPSSRVPREICGLELFVSARTMRALGLGAFRVQVERVLGNLKAAVLGDFVLALFDFRIEKFFHAAAL